MMKVYRIKGLGLYSQIHCVVASSMEKAVQLWREHYHEAPESIELYSEYVLIEAD